MATAAAAIEHQGRLQQGLDPKRVTSEQIIEALKLIAAEEFGKRNNLICGVTHRNHHKAGEVCIGLYCPHPLRGVGDIGPNAITHASNHAWMMGLLASQLPAESVRRDLDEREDLVVSTKDLAKAINQLAERYTGERRTRIVEQLTALTQGKDRV